MLEANADYWVPLLRLMAEMPNGTARKPDVEAEFGRRYKSEIPDWAYDTRQDDKTIIWEHKVQWARYELCQRGLMDPKARRGVWRITQEGRDWLAANPNATHIDVHSKAGREASRRKRRPAAAASMAPELSLDTLENARKHMPPEEFQRSFGQLYDSLVAVERTKAITPIDRDAIVATVLGHVRRIQDYLRGHSGAQPSSSDLCDWIYQCYLFDLAREAVALWALVDVDRLEPWQRERTERIVGVCRSKLR